MLEKCKKFTAEFLGTFLLCYIGCGAAVLNSSTPAIGPIIFVFLIGGLGSAFGPISGAHLKRIRKCLWSNKWSTFKSFSISYNAHDRKNDNF